MELSGYGDADTAMRLSLDNGLEVLCYDTDGRLCPIGMSTAGLAVNAFNLHLKGSGVPSEPGLSVQVPAVCCSSS